MLVGDGSGVGGIGAATRAVDVGVGVEGAIVGDGLAVGVGVAVSGGGSTATAGAVVGTGVGGRGNLVGGLPAVDGGSSNPNGSDSRKLTRLATPQLRRLNPRIMRSSTAQVDLVSDGRGSPWKVEGPCVPGPGGVRDAGDGGGGLGCGRGVGGVCDAGDG